MSLPSSEIAGESLKPRLVISKIPATGNGGAAVESGGDFILENSGGGGDGFLVLKNPFSFASSETSKMVMELEDVSRLSHSSGPLLGGSLTESPLFSPAEISDHFKVYRSNSPANSGQLPVTGKTVGRWLKERKERRKEENRVQNAQIHAAVSVAGVAAAIAAVASASANNGEDVPKTDAAMASAATLVAAQCVEAAEAMGADHEHLASVISSAVNVKSAGDIMTLSAAAATALRGAATLKSRALREVWNPTAVIPTEKMIRASRRNSYAGDFSNVVNYSGKCHDGDGFYDMCYGGLLGNGCELLKRTRNGDLHWKIVSVYINGMNQVVLKMKSRHVAGTIIKKKKNIVVDIINVPAWPGRHLQEGGDERRYFGLKTIMRGVVEFECRNQREYDMWRQGVTKLLSMAEERSYQFN